MTNTSYSMLALIFTASLFSNSCATVGDGDKTWKGGALGAVGGAIAGAGIAAATGRDIGKGALIGAAAGAAVGVTTGVVLDKQEEKLRKAGIQSTRDENGKLLVRMSGNALRFKTGGDVLSQSGKQQLYKIASILRQYPENRIAIYGHTDSDGSAEHNLKLSKLRAMAVEKQFRAYKVPPRCFIQTEGYGESRPIASNHTDEGKAANRRVELIISADEEEAQRNQKSRESRK